MAELFEMRVWELMGSVITFQTNDGAAGLIGFKIKDFMGLNPNSKVWFYEQISLNGVTPIVTLVKKGATTFASRLPAEPDQLNIPVVTLKFLRRDFVANFLPRYVDDTGEKLSISPGALKLIDDLIARGAVRQSFYADDRLAVLKGYGLTEEETQLLLAAESDRLWMFYAKVDLIMADERHRDEGNYVLFDVDEEDGLPDPDWIRAARPYLAHFRANFGHYTTDARIYERVLVVGRESLSPALRRAVMYLNREGADAQMLIAKDAGRLEERLNDLIKSGYPLPERGGRYDHSAPADKAQQEAD